MTDYSDLIARLESSADVGEDGYPTLLREAAEAIGELLKERDAAQGFVAAFISDCSPEKRAELRIAGHRLLTELDELRAKNQN